MPKRVFIIYGRDLDAHRELVKFIKALGLGELSFDTVAEELGANPFIADIVKSGISKADAVIALFTPDEHAALYSPETAESEGKNEARWQARPNVIFEAGVALGIAEDKTILCTLGGDIRLFSDLAGMHFIDLTSAKGKERLKNRLGRILGNLRPRRNWMRPGAGDFKGCLRRRWDYHDELEQMEKELRVTFAYRRNKSLFDMIESIALEQPGARWEQWTSEEFMDQIFQQVKYNDDAADSVYYYLIINGFITFKDIEPWWAPRCHDGYENCEEFFANSVEFSKLTSRAVGLLYKIQKLRGV